MRGAIADDRLLHLAQQVFEDVAFFGPDLGALALGRGKPRLGIQELEQAWPQVPSQIAAPHRPQVGSQRGIERQRLGIGAQHLAVLGPLLLLQQAQLVLEQRAAGLVGLAVKLALVDGAAVARGLVVGAAGDKVHRVRRA